MSGWLQRRGSGWSVPRADLNACTALIGAALEAEALFHAQQCAEKAMKAVLTWRQVAFKKTHDLDELKRVCLPLAGDAAAYLSGIEKLSQYAWRFRYPGAPYSPERAEAEAARRTAGQLLDALAVQLESQFGF